MTGIIFKLICSSIHRSAPMRRANALSRNGLETIIDHVQQALYLDVEQDGELVWSPTKDWNGAGICDELARMLAEHDLMPQRVAPFRPLNGRNSPDLTGTARFMS